MINLYKLEKLPRHQKLRKLAKIFSIAEARLFKLDANALPTVKTADIFESQEIDFFASAAKLLVEDGIFSADAKKAIINSTEFLKTAADSSACDLSLFLRTLNTIKHILLAEIGKDQSDWDFTNSDGKLDPEKRQVFLGMQVYLEDIRSPFNVGAMFRTAESFGVEKIILSPLCADPRHRRAERTAMGCVDVIPWERRDFFRAPEGAPTANPAEALPIFALETGGVPLAEFPFPRRGIMVIGSEELGVSPQALSAADASLGRVSIPCYGAKGSLNVSVAFGIAVQAWGQRIGKGDRLYKDNE
jgi:RNA methyltransferase, TrmH family